MSNITEILKKNTLEIDDICYLLENSDNSKELFEYAYQIKSKYVGTQVYFRGLIELSNICSRDCYYCGIRKSNQNLDRFKLSKDEILEAAIWSYKANYGSVVLQGGERSDKSFVDFIEEILQEIKAETKGEIGITLSLGEQTEDTYRRWFEAGAHRYLLRIESSNKDIYNRIHPKTDSFENRLNCIKLLRKVGYQTGTGVMIGLPGQTIEDIAKDIFFYKENDIDMIGMGPFIPHHDTPMANDLGDFDKIAKDQFELALRTIAVTRILLKDVNIASSTALQALDSKGREKGLMAGANIIMPNVTDTKYRRGYQLYDGKPGLDENCISSRNTLENSIESAGESVGYNQWGDSPHFKNKRNQ